jgi:hypothetical protein
LNMYYIQSMTDQTHPPAARVMSSCRARRHS